MRRAKNTDATLLVASDKSRDADLVKKLLSVEFGNVFVTANAENASADFDHCQPDVLILAFNGLKNTERYYLGLYRHSSAAKHNLHRAIVLCSKDEVEYAYALCREGIFDDYMLFWPMTNDAPRLLMTVHLALREIRLLASNAPTGAEFSVQVKRLSSMESEMKLQLERGNKYIESINDAVRQSDSEANAAFDQFSQRLVKNEVTGVTVIKNSEDLKYEIGRVKKEIIDAPHHKLSDTVVPLKQWAGELGEVAAPHLESLKALNKFAENMSPTLLVVDDEPFQHKIINFILKEARYQVKSANSVVEAMNMLYREEHPDLILMDVMLPGIDGMEAVRQIKADKHLSGIPVIMMTGNSEKEILKGSLDAGACDFVVKPFAGNTLLLKISHALGKHS